MIEVIEYNQTVTRWLACLLGKYCHIGGSVSLSVVSVGHSPVVTATLSTVEARAVEPMNNVHAGLCGHLLHQPNEWDRSAESLCPHDFREPDLLWLSFGNHYTEQTYPHTLQSCQEVGPEPLCYSFSNIFLLKSVTTQPNH